jgi:hypothetical protein
MRPTLHDERQGRQPRATGECGIVVQCGSESFEGNQGFVSGVREGGATASEASSLRT